MLIVMEKTIYQSICKVLSRYFLLSRKLVILTDPAKDKEHAGAEIVVRNLHAGAEIVVRKTLICSTELTCTISKNTSIAGSRNQYATCIMVICIDKH